MIKFSREKGFSNENPFSRLSIYCYYAEDDE